MLKAKVLVVDDEPDICDLVTMTLARMEVAACSAHSLSEAKQVLQKSNFDLCLTDMCLPDGDGIELVDYLQKHFPGIPAAVITAFGNVEGAVNSLKAGAFDYVSKPIDLNILRRLINTALKCVSDSDVDSHPSRNYQLHGKSSVIEALNQMITKVARSQAPVHIYGASGTGKECVARAIHANGPRADQPFIPVNCGAIPRELLESEFFGYKKGSFTGATKDQQGLFQAASGGTLFLDEVAELPLEMQAKLLRAIQERAIRAVGSQEEITVDVRILSATHQDLLAMVNAGKFRQDLFYRINVIHLQVPTLAERPEDIPLLAEQFMSCLNENNRFEPATLSPAAINALMTYPFPGNVRELENILERAVALSEKAKIDVSDLHLSDRVAAATRTEGGTESNVSLLEDNDDLPSYLDQVEKEAILHALEKNHWNKTKTAQALGISFRALRYRLKKLELEE